MMGISMHVAEVSEIGLLPFTVKFSTGLDLLEHDLDGGGGRPWVFSCVLRSL